MTRKPSVDNLFYGSRESKTFSGGISKSNVIKLIKLIQFFSAEFCLTIYLTLKVPLLEPMPRVLNKNDDF